MSFFDEVRDLKKNNDLTGIGIGLKQRSGLRDWGKILSGMSGLKDPIGDPPVTVRFVLREPSIFILCFDYAIEWLDNSSVMLWSGAAKSPSAVSKFCGI